MTAIAQPEPLDLTDGGLVAEGAGGDAIGFSQTGVGGGYYG